MSMCQERPGFGMTHYQSRNRVHEYVMLRAWLAVAVVLGGCAVPEPSSAEPDGGPPVVDAAVVDPVDAGEAGEAGPVCTDENRGDSCVSVAEPCAGGFRYGCYGGRCPTGDVGACTVLSENTTTSRYTETCCEKAACTRGVQIGRQCAERFDGGLTVGWHCPGGVQPPAKGCQINGTPAPPKGAPTEYCCE
jgi:hypothetical protein